MANGLTLEVLAERITALDRLTQTSLEAAQEAIEKAETAQEKRFDGVNEFRAALADQAANFISKTEVAQLNSAASKERTELRNLVNELRIAQRDLIPRAEHDTAMEGMRTAISVLQGSVNRLLITVLTSLVVALITALVFAVIR